MHYVCRGSLLQVFAAILRDNQQLVMVFLGEGGTGKSTTINAFMDFATRWGLATKIAIAAPSGVAASLIGGQTFHALAKVPVSNGSDNEPDDNQPMPDLEPTLQHLYMIIIDEISMLPLKVLGQGFQNMQSLCANIEAFGGLDVIMVGDFFQLMPPGGKAVFELGEGRYEDYGRSLWLSVNTCIELTEHNRCKDSDLAIVLNAIRTGCFTPKANELILSRVLGSATKEQLTIPAQSTCILQWNTDVNDHNFMAPHFIRGKKVYRLSADITINASKTTAPANHPIFSEAVAAGTSRDGHLPHLDIIIGSKVSILNGNKYLNDTGVGNGSTGIVCGVLPHNALENCLQRTIILPDGCATETSVLIPRIPVTHILIKIIEDKVVTENDVDDGRYDPRTQFRYPGLPPNVFAVARTVKQNQTYHVRVSQFPIRLSHAFTVFKAQGQTLPCVIVAVPPSKNQAYVAASRVRTLKGLYFLQRWTDDDREQCGVLPTVATVMKFLRGVETRTLASLTKFL